MFGCLRKIFNKRKKYRKVEKQTDVRDAAIDDGVCGDTDEQACSNSSASDAKNTAHIDYDIVIEKEIWWELIVFFSFLVVIRKFSMENNNSYSEMLEFLWV